MEGYEKFKKDIYTLTKIDLNAYKEKQMKRRIDTLITKNKAKSYDEYVDMIKKDKEKFEQFVSFLTINVSEFYRNPDQWRILDKDVFPKLIERFGKNLKIWSAACSTGDEPYSLVMALSKFLPLNQIKIVATDIDKQILDKARMGLYNEKSLAGVPEEMKKKYFTKVGASYKVSDEIKARVEFKQQDLLKELTEGHPLTLADPEPMVHVDDYGDNAIGYVARVWCGNADYWTVYFDLMDGLKLAFDAAGVEMTYPHVNVHMVGHGEKADGAG